MQGNTLYYGDNLDVLREHIPAESVDLIYLDPPFNSQQSFNVLFATPKGKVSEAQVTAFKDSWSWGEEAEREYDQIIHGRNTAVAELIRSLRLVMHENDMMAYLVMMTNRLLELHRVLKSSGCIYLHCDPIASHYLKIVLDSIFGQTNYSNEIIWRRTTTKNDYRQGAINWPRVHDIIFMYYKDKNSVPKPVFHQPFGDYDQEYLKRSYRHVDEQGRHYMLDNLAAPGRGMRGHPQYEFLGVTRFWRYSKEKMEQLFADGRIIQAKPGAVPRYKRYLDEMPGIALGDVWNDIPPVQGQAKEYLGYPTQKPLALLERIILASTNEGDAILDPFCGCGTAVFAAQKHQRKWIGIDITHLAIQLVEKRLRDAFADANFVVRGRPEDLAGAQDLALRDKHEFERWACWLVNAQAYTSKKGADKGIDGLIYFTDVVQSKLFTQKIIVSVKGGQNVGVTMIRELMTVVEQNDAQIGLFVTLVEPTKPMMVEAAKAGYYKSGNGGNYPRIQILKIEDLLSGIKRPEFPQYTLGEQTFKTTERETKFTHTQKPLSNFPDDEDEDE
jgi:DNA modification methylase